MIRKLLLPVCLVFLITSGCSRQDTGDTQGVPSSSNQPVASAGQLTYSAPAEWTAEQPASQMRRDQFRLPGVEGMAAAELAVFSGIGGTVDANLQRWYSQFTQPDGGNTAAIATTETRTVNGLDVTVTYCSGTYLKSRSPMMMGGPVDELSGYAMLAAIVSTPAGPWYFKATGPSKTIDHWRPSFDTFVQSFRIIP